MAGLDAHVSPHVLQHTCDIFRAVSTENYADIAMRTITQRS